MNEHYDAAIVLANEMDQDGQLNPLSQSRMDMAADIFKKGEAAILLTSGWAYRKDVPYSIAEAMRNYAIGHHHIDPLRVLADPHSRDTVGDAVFTKRHFAKPRQWRRLLVITNEYHAKRTQAIFAFIYGPAYSIEVGAAPLIQGGRSELLEFQSLQTFRDTFQGINPGDDQAIWERLRENHPFYNGIIHPKI